eukprot:TRINITY_DN36683_c0_g1_i1.p1 TRINITY_DN36683_c0_g1~~TRINITY_DN36683_c0_g1_i1.p1  ORF type:complete len:1088 (+),score=167.69 TRINITY_DN36683_c0_g1_i1:25-3288(+)
MSSLAESPAGSHRRSLVASLRHARTCMQEELNDELPSKPRPSLQRSSTGLSSKSTPTNSGNLHHAATFGTFGSDQPGGRSRRSMSAELQDIQIDDRLDAEEVLRCRVLLESIRSGSIPDIDQSMLETEFRNCVIFKNRPLTRCKVLHFAIVEAALHEDGDIVSSVLEKNAQVDAKATYQTTKKEAVYETELQAIHIAAGLGSIHAMEALKSHWCSQPGKQASSFLCQEATVKEVKDAASEVKTPFYSPIHDAVYLGHKDAVIWLLENKAEPSTNKDGCTPLHFVARIGGSLRTDHVRELVTELLHHKCNLEARSYGEVKPYPSESVMQNKIPLEVAAMSQYPKELLYLLAPSYQSTDLSTPRLFADILLLSKRNINVAEAYARQLVDRVQKSGDNFRNIVIKEAQVPGSVDRMASLLYMVPGAGAAMLELLTVDPEIQDYAKNPIPTRSDLRGSPLRCTYQTDTTWKGGVRWPCWKFDANKPMEERDWQQRFMPDRFVPLHAPELNAGRQDSVYDVEAKVVMLPNMLDVDILMALTRTWDGQNHMFAKLPVQATITCLWDNLVWPVFASSWIFMVIELTALVFWGLSAPSPHSNSNSPQNVPFYWSILLSGALRELINLLWWFLAHWSKWHSHDDATMKSLWEIKQFLADPWFLSMCILLLCRFSLVLPCCYESFYTDSDPVMTEWEQAMLAVNAFTQGFAVTYMLRLLNRFKRILAIFKTFFSRTILEMLLIALMIFASFSLAFLMLIRKREAGWTVMYLYRGLMFGDGDGLDRMGLNLDDEKPEHSNHFALVVFMMCGTILFNITILNLVIAIYGNEYDATNSETHLHFLKERAKYCLIYVQMYHKQRLLHIIGELYEFGQLDFGDASLLRVADVLQKGLDIVSSLFCYARRGAQSLLQLWTKPMFWLSLLPALGGLLLIGRAMIAFAYCMLNTMPVSSACVIALAQLTWQALLIQADWFQPDAPEIVPGVAVRRLNCGLGNESSGTVSRKEGDRWIVQSDTGNEFDAYENELEFLKPASFLWVCHRADFDEHHFFSPEEVSKRDVDDIMQNVDDLKATVHKTDSRIETLEGKIEVLTRLLEDKL